VADPDFTDTGRAALLYAIRALEAHIAGVMACAKPEGQSE
jgi:hypothetical protein